MSKKNYAELCALLREAGTLTSIKSLLGWDQETYMPDGATPGRSEQNALLAAITHERRTSTRVGDLLGACEQDKALTRKGSPEAANLREIRRDYDLATRLPGDLVAAIARTTSQAQHAWKEAREKDDFAMFLPWLDKVMGLLRRKAECYGTPKGGELYDALIDEYEPGATAREIEAVFTPLRARLTDLVREVKQSGVKVNTKCLKTRIPAARQHAFGLWVLERMGFNLAIGRLDVTTHPFCSEVGPADTRLTTRYRDQHFTDALYSTLHEMGHGLYEQGLPKGDGTAASLFGQPLAEAVSLGIHESQSRMWENFVGRSLAFWKWALPKSRKHLGDALAGFTPKDLFTAVNTVTPSLIRVEADEGTYNMHVMVRFELERAMLRGDLKPKDLPGEWNKRYKAYLGLDVPDNTRGCLQDVHWSFGLVGYFPTYTLGNLYAAQFWETINTAIPGLDAKIAKGEFAPLLAWLRTNIHAHGRRYRAGELCERVTGQSLSPEPLMRHLRSRASRVYGVNEEN